MIQERENVQEPAATTKTSEQICQSPEEDAKAEAAVVEIQTGEEEMNHPAWLLIIVGILIAVAGLVWLMGPSIPWLGKLLGDIVIERENFRFYFPLGTCVVLSLLLSGVFWLIRFLQR